MQDKLHRMQELKDQLNRAAYAYYTLAEPVMADVQSASGRSPGNASSVVPDIWNLPVTWSLARAERSRVPPETFIA